MRQWRLFISSMAWCKGWLSIWRCLHKAKFLTMSHTHSHCVSPSLVTETWARTRPALEPDQLPSPSAWQGDRTAKVWKVTGEGRCAHSLCEPGGQQRGCLGPCNCANHCNSRAAACHAQHSCAGLNSITGLFRAHGLTTCSVTRNGSSWPLSALCLMSGPVNHSCCCSLLTKLLVF